MADSLTMDDVSQRVWALYRPNGDCRSPSVILEAGGRVIGYNHPNEACWAPHGDGFAFLSRAGKPTSISADMYGSDADGWRIRMVYPDRSDRAAHVLVEVPKNAAAPATPARQSAPSPPWVPESSTPARAVDNPEFKITVDIGVPEAAERFLDGEIERVFLIANNRDLSPSVIESWNLGDSDVVVQYNRPVHFDMLARRKCHKLHFYYPNERACWGFTDDGQPEEDYHLQAFRSLTFAMANVIPRRVWPYLQSLDGTAHAMAVIPARHVILHQYPAGRLPSCGFISVGFFRFLHWIRRQQARPELELFLAGFTGIYPPGIAWAGHDFTFEQAVYGTWTDLIRLGIDSAPFDAEALPTPRRHNGRRDITPNAGGV
jgi:hypothetical protein